MQITAGRDYLTGEDPNAKTPVSSVIATSTADRTIAIFF